MFNMALHPAHRSVCGAAEKLSDLHSLWFPLHCVWSILGPLDTYCTGKMSAVVLDYRIA